MRPELKRICIGACLVLLPARPSLAQFPQSVICQFERIATAALDSAGKIVSGSESSKGEMVISNLNSDAPVGSGNIGRRQAAGSQEIQGHDLAGRNSRQ